MTIQEYIRVAINGVPNEDFVFYKPYFMDMSCKHCMYNGYACKDPKTDDVCIEYRVEKKDLQFKKTGSR